MSAWSDATLLRVARDVEDETLRGLAEDFRKIADDCGNGIDERSRAALRLIADKTEQRPRVYDQPGARVAVPS